ncbi:N-acetyllactosaminide beta-1,6-N-acetylglucosaminyl-transferase [Patella vulgata]|uniref:N-acetyllactosaminide beta-1,6-N-acetylglucosaminyl-transferase n=1 Tax=Patella vulgata TaxID=6465 RepID=UPI00217F845F|nr:N-acetyllactosaminide beta-1,6-N-acetylglucosaminyl-transferase [Patella vulgata]
MSRELGNYNKPKENRIWTKGKRIKLVMCVTIVPIWLTSMLYNLASLQRVMFATKLASTSKHSFSLSHDLQVIEPQVCDVLLKNTSLTNRFIDNVMSFMKFHPRKAVLPEAYIPLTSSCSKYISNRGFLVHNSTKREESFPIAFTLMVYKHVEQVERLLKAIYRPHNVYCVHVDSKSSLLIFKAIRSIVKCLPNVFLVSNRTNVIWGEFSVLEPEINCLKELVLHKVKWRYVINLTGQEYPLKTNYQLVRILRSYKGANDIDGSAAKMGSKGYYYSRIKGRPPPPHGITPCKGLVHLAASREFVDYVLHNKTALDFLEWCKSMSIPDETYFTSLNNNKHLQSPGSYTGDIEDETRDSFIRYKIVDNDYGKCGSKYTVRGVCIQGIPDLHLMTTSNKLFVNKFLYEFQPLAYDCLENWYFNQVKLEMAGKLEFNTTVYEKSTIVRYRYIPPDVV